MLMLICVIHNWMTYAMGYYEYRYPVVPADTEF